MTIFRLIHGFFFLFPQERSGGVEDWPSRELVDGLQLRFSLLGGMFDIIQRNATVTTDWAILLVQLISFGVIDYNNNSYVIILLHFNIFFKPLSEISHVFRSLFTTVIDMLGTLIHWTLASDTSGVNQSGDENKKQYQNLMKKLKKEVGERQSPELQCVRQLLPLPKITMEVFISLISNVLFFFHFINVVLFKGHCM